MSTDDLLSYHMDNFTPEDYVADFDLSRTLDSRTRKFYEMLSSMYHEVFSTHSPGERLLDVGSGPTLWHVMSASAKYKSITLSDPLPQNRHMQQMYMNDVSQDDRWTEHFKLTARLEGDETKWREIGARLRSCVNDVIYCNVHEDHPLGEERADDLHDCVMSSLCLEVACKDIPSYNKAVKKLVSLGKPGAPIVIGGVTKCTYYEFGGKYFKDLYLLQETIKEAITDAGCIVTKFMHSDGRHGCSDNEGVFVMEARKM